MAADKFAPRALNKLVHNPAMKFRRWWLIRRLKYNAMIKFGSIDVQIAPDVQVGRDIRIDFAKRAKGVFHVGPRSRIGDNVRIRLWDSGGSIYLGERVDIRGECVLNVAGGTLRLDGPNNLSWSVTVHCAESVHLERHAHVAEYSTIVDSSHFYTEPDVWSYHNTKTAPVEIGEDVWICPKATITSGVTIGDHTIVASSTVVVKDVPSGVLISGVPGKIVRELDLPWK